MNKQYIAIYNNKKYEVQDIMDMVQPYNVRYWHKRQTWESPEEEDIDYKIDISAEFDKAVKIACVEFENEDDEAGINLEFDGMIYQIQNRGFTWYEFLEAIGWSTFVNINGLEDFQESEEKVRVILEEWIDSVAADNAWEIVYNGEARSW